MRPVLILVLALALLACSPAPDPEERIATSSEGRRTTRETAPTDPEPEIVAPGEPEPDPITIAGLLVGMRGDPIAGRRFVSVGRDRDQRTGWTGPHGEIAIEGVVPPYDLRVEGAGHGPLLLFGLTRPDPTVELGEDASFVAPPEPVRVGVLAPPCGEEHCIVDVATASGAASVLSEPNADGDAVAIVDVDETGRIHVLVHDSANTRFAYGQTETSARGDIGVVHARAVPTTMVHPGAVTDGFEGASWTAAVALEVGTATFQLGAANAASLATGVPLLDDASWRFAVSAATLGRVSMAWSGDLRGAESPPLVLPPALGDVAVADGRLRWRAAGNALATIDVVDVARAVYRYRIVTSMTDFPLAKLENLGLRGMERGTHELVLTVVPDASLDEAVDPDAATRSRHRDPRRPGRAVYARVPFDVTP